MAERFTDELRLAAGDQWDRIIHHKFTKELASGKIDRKVLKKYLIQDHRFIDAFTVLLATMISKTRTLNDRIDACQFLAIITSKENTYFERSFDKLGVSEKERNEQNIPNDTCTRNLINLMLTVANNGILSEMLSVLIVCEWTYLSWGQIVTKTTTTTTSDDDTTIEKVNRDDFVTYEWIDLHSGTYFESVVEYLRNLLDNEVSTYNISKDQQEKCKELFLQTVQLEEDFFNNAYNIQI